MNITDTKTDNENEKQRLKNGNTHEYISAAGNWNWKRRLKVHSKMKGTGVRWRTGGEAQEDFAKIHSMQRPVVFQQT